MGLFDELEEKLTPKVEVKKEELTPADFLLARKREELAQKRIKTFSGGMNSDIAPELLPPDTARYIPNQLNKPPTHREMLNAYEAYLKTNPEPRMTVPAFKASIGYIDEALSKHGITKLRKPEPSPSYPIWGIDIEGNEGKVSIFNTETLVFEKQDGTPIVSESDYRASMPSGLKEIQDRVFAQGSLIGDEPTTKKRDFKYEGDKVVFEENPEGRFTVANPTVEITVQGVGIDSVGYDSIQPKFKNQPVEDWNLKEIDRCLPIYGYQGQTLDFGQIPTPESFIESVDDGQAGLFDFMLSDNTDQLSEFAYIGFIEAIKNAPSVPFDPDLEFKLDEVPLTETSDVSLVSEEVRFEVTDPNGDTIQTGTVIKGDQIKIQAVSNRFYREAEPLPEEQPKEDKRKIKSTQVMQDGIIFDSKLENYFYNLLKDNNINFIMKQTFELVPAFTYRHENIRPMSVTPDYILPDYKLIVDTKGWGNETIPLRYKILKHKLHLEGTEYQIEMPSSQKACRAIIEQIHNGWRVEEPLTESAGTRRKNKLKNNEWTWDEGKWSKNGVTYDANYLMSLRTYEFTELLLNN